MASKLPPVITVNNESAVCCYCLIRWGRYWFRGKYEDVPCCGSCLKKLRAEGK